MLCVFYSVNNTESFASLTNSFSTFRVWSEIRRDIKVTIELCILCRVMGIWDGRNMICIGATCSSVSLVLRKLRLYYLNHMKKYRVIDSDQKQLVDHLVYVRRCTFSVVGWTLDPNLLLPATLTLTSWLDSCVIRYLSLGYHFNDSTRQFRFPELIVPKEIKVMMRVHKQLKRPKNLYHVNLGHRAQLEA